MTNEKARIVIGNIPIKPEVLDDCYDITEYQEAKAMAIKALEQQSCGDAINREKARQFLYERIDRLNDDELYDIFSRIIDDMYNELPSITPQPKIGKWIDDGWYAEGHSEHAYRCSKCDKNYIGYVGEHKYCPNCGAKMEVEE